ncbi:S-adenosyl-L-methionine-dependent methyltransferase [Apodospora peruviana]|uniref:S-adenosyl-L-methionine-dependent methyltransferase n=1 Tax=Apodospora peruviana TaxID=516989 RepID=A0AAE0ID88_9PEZI|nr:S-adenosyl-L-methionine-dependent methyltransferase [Apodospora peruviana]
MNTQVAQEYDTQGDRFSEYITEFPFGNLEDELFLSALLSEDITGQTVLDLGGGTGTKAREAIAAGAARVDVLDISVEMMRSGQAETAAALGEEKASLITWHAADISKDMSHLPIDKPGSYDLVIIGWAFDHAHDLAEYEGMWRNAAAYLRPGGRFVGVRVGDPRSATWDGRYGTKTSAFVERPEEGVLRYRYAILLEPPLEFEASSLKVSMAGSTEIAERYGFGDFRDVNPAEAALVKARPDFWRPFVENPGFVVFQATKMREG